MGRFTKILDREIDRIVDDFERRGKRRIKFGEYRDMRDIRRMYKHRLQEIGPTEGSAMFENAKQTIVNEAVDVINRYFQSLLNRPSVVIRNPEGTYSIGEPAPTPAPLPHGYGHPVHHFRLTPSTRYS